RKLDEAEERAADGPGVRHPDSSARSRSDSRDARPVDLHHGRYLGARIDVEGYADRRLEGIRESPRDRVEDGKLPRVPRDHALSGAERAYGRGDRLFRE